MQIGLTDALFLVMLGVQLHIVYLEWRNWYFWKHRR